MRISSTLVRIAVIAVLTLALGLAPAIPVQAASAGSTGGWFNTLISWVLGSGDSPTQVRGELNPDG